MALTLAKKSGTFPGKTELEQALKDFRSILSDDEKTRLDASQKSGLPSEASVIVLTSEIDATQTTRTSRRVGPRLQPFLEHVQRFAKIVDTFSQVGTITPQFQEFASLYSSSASLQDALCAYYAAVIRLCQQAITVGRRKGILQVPKAALLSFDHDFAELRKRIEQTSEEVHAQIRIAAGRVQVEEASLNHLEREKSDESRKLLSKFSSDAQIEWSKMIRWREEQDLRQLRKDKQQLRDKLSTIDHRIPWRQARRQCVKDTGIWYRGYAPFATWRQNSTSDLLWLFGSMGSGKSIVTANIIADLYEDVSSITSTCKVSYFFCQNEHQQTLNSRSIFGSFANQLLDDIITQADRPTFEQLQASARDLSDVDAVIAFIARSLTVDGTCFVVLDGIDQLKTDEAQEVLIYLDDLMRLTLEKIKIKVLITSRPGIRSQILKVFPTAETITLSTSDAEDDITTYIDTTLMQKIETEELQLTDINLLSQVRDYLVYGSQGMFLWTKLMLEEICLCQNDEEVIECLPATPLELVDVYRKMLERISRGRNSETIISAFKWIVGAVRPLKSPELREALTLAPGQKKFQMNKMPHNLHGILRGSGGLIFVDEDEDTVHLIHHSLKQAMQTNIKDRTDSMSEFLSSFEAIELDLTLGHLCMTYLLFENFSRQLVRADMPSRSVVIDLSKITQQVMLPNSSSGSLIASVLTMLQKSKSKTKRFNSTFQSSFDIERKLREMAEDMNVQRAARSQCEQGFQFLDYAKFAWIDHTKKCTSNHRDLWKLFKKHIDSTDIHICRPWKKEETSPWARETLPQLTKSTNRLSNPSTEVTDSMHWAYPNHHWGVVEYHFSQLYGKDSVGRIANIELIRVLFQNLLSGNDAHMSSFIERLVNDEQYLKNLSYQSRISFAICLDLAYIPGYNEHEKDKIGEAISSAATLEDTSIRGELESRFHDLMRLSSLQVADIWPHMEKLSDGLVNSLKPLPASRAFVLANLSLFELAILLDRASICRLIAQSFTDWDRVQEHYCLALACGREKVASEIWNATKHNICLWNPKIFRNTLFSIELCMKKGHQARAAKLSSLLPRHSQLLSEDFLSLLEHAWHFHDDETFQNLLNVANYPFVFRPSKQCPEGFFARLHKGVGYYVHSKIPNKMEQALLHWERREHVCNGIAISEMLIANLTDIKQQTAVEYSSYKPSITPRQNSAVQSIRGLRLECICGTYKRLLEASEVSQLDGIKAILSIHLRSLLTEIQPFCLPNKWVKTSSRFNKLVDELSKKASFKNT